MIKATSERDILKKYRNGGHGLVGYVRFESDGRNQGWLPLIVLAAVFESIGGLAHLGMG
jgi:hypothetical protein